MRVGDAVMAHYAPAVSAPGTFAGLVEALGGGNPHNTKPAAEVLGVSQRQVQRLRAHETGSAAETRGKRALEPAKAKLTDAVEGRDWDRLREQAKAKGLRFHVHGELWVSKEKSTRTIDGTVTNPEYIDALFDALQARDESDVELAFNEAVFGPDGNYFIDGAAFGEVDRFTLAP